MLEKLLTQYQVKKKQKKNTVNHPPIYSSTDQIDCKTKKKGRGGKQCLRIRCRHVISVPMYKLVIFSKRTINRCLLALEKNEATYISLVQIAGWDLVPSHNCHCKVYFLFFCLVHFHQTFLIYITCQKNCNLPWRNLVLSNLLERNILDTLSISCFYTQVVFGFAERICGENSLATYVGMCLSVTWCLISRPLKCPVARIPNFPGDQLGWGEEKSNYCDFTWSIAWHRANPKHLILLLGNIAYIAV